MKDGAARDCHFCVVSILDVYFVLVKNGNVVGVSKFGYAEERVAFDPRHNVDVLCRVAYVMVEFIDVLCHFYCIVGHVEGLVGLSSCWYKACLFLSFVVLTLDIAAVLATAEGMDPSSTPACKCCVDPFIVVIVLLVNLATRWGVIG
jgi:hypothetical protein